MSETTLLDFYVKLNPRKKGDFGYCRMGNDYNNHENIAKANEFNSNTCKTILSNLKEHYKDYDIVSSEVCDNSYELELETKIESLKDTISELEDQIKALTDKGE